MVSERPQEWRSILGLNGPEWKLRYSAAQWVDAMGIDDQTYRELEAWMMIAGNDYMRPKRLFVTHVWDEDGVVLVEQRFQVFAEAAKSVGRSEEEEREAASAGNGAVEELEGYVLTKRALKRLGGNWSDPTRWFDAAAILYTRDVIMPKKPLVVGLWWREAFSRDGKSAESGLVFPEALSLFDVEDEEGDIKSFTEQFPEVDLPERFVLDLE